IKAPDKLIISVMAGTTVDELIRLTGSSRVIRAMSSPAAKDKLAYSPWYASGAATSRDRDLAQAVLSTCGLSDELENEADIEVFTALTGPVPGFVALFATAMVDFATSHGIAPEIADRAVRQLFLASGTMLSEDPMTPAEHVQQMIDYAGTTAAGLEAMQQLSIPETIAEGLNSAVARVRDIG
ncbi:MAG: pyrroline-5-carboxylate reductase dimerization domain-containing protein, partial [Ruegeria sp.]|nr:pyrroline-5-carboxylate reductase dimerization domain-containing protein [Ruegeria sp.]